MHMCIKLQQRPEKACITDDAIPGYWACQLANPDKLAYLREQLARPERAAPALL